MLPLSCTSNNPPLVLSKCIWSHPFHHCLSHKNICPLLISHLHQFFCCFGQVFLCPIYLPPPPPCVPAYPLQYSLLRSVCFFVWLIFMRASQCMTHIICISFTSSNISNLLLCSTFQIRCCAPSLTCTSNNPPRPPLSDGCLINHHSS